MRLHGYRVGDGAGWLVEFQPGGRRNRRRFERDGRCGLGRRSLMTTYLANAFVTSAGESGVVDATALKSSAQDFLTRPIA